MKKKILVATHARIAEYINTCKMYQSTDNYTYYKNERLERFYNYLKIENEKLYADLQSPKAKRIVERIVYLTCVGGLCTTSAKSLADVCKCSIPTVYRMITLLKKTKQFAIGYENKYRKGKYIFIDTLSKNYSVIMDYVFRLTTKTSEKMRYVVPVAKEKKVSSVFGIDKNDEVGLIIEQLRTSNRLANYVSLTELKNYNDGLLTKQSLLAKLKERILSAINLQKQAIEYQKPIMMSLYDLMVSSTKRLDLLESIPRIMVKLLQLTKDKPQTTDVIRAYQVFVKMVGNFLDDKKMANHERSYPRYFEKLYLEQLELAQSYVGNSGMLLKAESFIDTKSFTRFNEVVERETTKKPKIQFYNWLEERE